MGLIAKYAHLNTSEKVMVAIQATTNQINKLTDKLDDLDYLLSFYTSQELAGVEMSTGDVVKHKETGRFGTVHYSTFGFSIHTWDEEEQMLAKGIGEKPKVLQQYWEVVDLPEGYEKMPHGGVRKIES